MTAFFPATFFIAWNNFQTFRGLKIKVNLGHLVQTKYSLEKLNVCMQGDYGFHKSSQIYALI